MKKPVISLLSTLVGAGIGAVAVSKGVVERKTKESDKWKELADKHLVLMQLFNQWMITKQEGKSVIDYFERENIKSIAIYGMSFVGERLYDELKKSNIDVKFAIDKKADRIYSDVEVVTPDDMFEEVDAIVVTPVFYYEEIESFLTKKTDITIISFEDILYCL